MFVVNFKTNHMEIKNKQQEMANLLRKSYDCIGKMDAAKFLKQYYPNLQLSDFMKAYKFAYE